MGRYALTSITKDSDGKILYGCKECPLKHHDKEFLEHHLYLHYNEFRFLCGICGVGLKRREHLERHTQGHMEVRPHLCPDCGKAFKRKEHLNIHRSIHSGDKNINCAVCNKSFYRKDHLQKHLQTHNKIFIKNIGGEDSEIVDFKQELIEYDEKPIIPEEVISDEDMKMEIDDGSADSPAETSQAPTEPETSEAQDSGKESTARPFACTVCNKTYKRRHHLQLHSITHLSKTSICEECGRAFYCAELLLEHVNRVHSNTPGYIEHMQPETILGTETEPAARFVSQPVDNLLVPMSSKPEHRPHECTVCHRKFKRRQHLKVHANVHLKIKFTVWCSLCNAGFFDNEQFEAHQCPGAITDNTVEHDESEAILPDTATNDARKENSYPTEFIEVEENIKIVDETRIDIRPEEMHIPTPLRVFVCKYCSKPFKRKDHYRIHLNIHTGVKSFFCPYCDKGFYRKDHMKKHALVHEKSRPPLKQKPRKQLPDLYPIDRLPKTDVKPEITIHAPTNSQLRVPLSIKVPYKMVMSLGNGEQRAVTVDPQPARH
ncbi:uncharacterized protein [Epargyreus clarus]